MSKDGGPWVPFYPSDWLAGTRGMTAAETGVYITLVAMMYERGGPIRDDRAKLARLCGIPAGSFGPILDRLIADGKVLDTPDGFANRKCSEVLLTRQNLQARNSANAQSRWQKTPQKQYNGSATAYKPQSEGASETDANHNHNHIKEDLLHFWAKAITGEHYVAPSAIKPEMARELVARGLVTTDQLKAKGIAA